MKAVLHGLFLVSLTVLSPTARLVMAAEAKPGRIIIPPVVETVDDTVYADRPTWYKPGHPLHPAESATIETLPGFKAERIFSVPNQYGSVTALTVDPQGRLLSAAQHEPGIYRITPPALNDPGAETKVEKLGGAAMKVGWSHGLLYAFDSLYVTVSEGNNAAKTGVYRLRDNDGDNQFDQADLVFELKGAGEHGPHNIVPGPDGKSLFMMCGNGTRLPDGVERRRPVAMEGIDRLMPPGFESGRYSVEGWVLRFDPDGGNRELMAAGLRNSFDLAFNRAGDLFTFDSDMEGDLGTPWYRPTRICHLVSGAEFGWRAGAAMWPEYLEDGVAPVINVGPASPTGVVFGYGTRFPSKYQQALFACDWTFATIHAVHLTPDEAGYRAEVEQFVGGVGLPVTDIVVGRDGALYFAVGGRRLGSAIYRVSYVGDESTVQSSNTLMANEQSQRALRLELETLHGREDRATVGKVWAHLGHTDRAIRFAARVAVEKQPVAWWREQALKETNPDASLTALLALARQGSASDQREVLTRLNALSWDGSPTEQRLRILRVYELALARSGDQITAEKTTVQIKLRPRFPDGDGLVNRELTRLLCFLGDASMIEPLLGRMAADAGERPLLGSGYFVRNPKYGAVVRNLLESAPLLDRMHYAQMLLWNKAGWTKAQRRRYFELVADAVTRSKGAQHREVWSRIRQIALEQLPANERAEFEVIQATAPPLAEGLPTPKGPGRDWTLDQTLKLTEAGLASRNVENGKTMFAAAGCVLCHQIGGEGGAIGPDLTSVGQRFTVRDILEATIHPSKAISDQYQMMTLELTDGKTMSGRIVSRDERVARIATDLMKPNHSIAIANELIRSVRPEPVSTMPSGLLNALNEDELLNLVAYLVAGEKPKLNR